MWFSNAMVYQFELAEEVDMNAALIEERLKPCPPHARFTYGWMNTIADEMTHEAAGSALICMGKEERILPRSVIQKMLAEKIEQIELQHGRTVKRSEKAQMAEELEFELLPKSFCIQKRLNAIVDYSSNHLVINSSSANQASQLISLLRKSVSGMNIEPLSIDQNLSFQFSEWIQDPSTLPPNFQLASDCVLFSPDNEKKRIQCKGYELPAEEVITLLSQGMTTAELSLIWNERIQFTLTHEFVFKKLKSLDYLIDDFKEISKLEEELQQKDAALTLLSGEFRQLFAELLKALAPKKTAQVQHEEELTEA